MLIRELLPHEQRVVSEKDELDVKLKALKAFLLTDFFKTLDPEEQLRLANQSVYMTAYSDVLGARIAAFK